MIEVSVTSNLDSVTADLQAKLLELVENSSPYLLAAATGVLSVVHDRIHVQGKRANGSDIGTYANSYIRMRAKNNRGADRKIILSLTRQMENDFSPVEDGGKTGLGFNNVTNFDKATWMEERFEGTYNLSAEEQLIVVQVLEDVINGVFE